MYETPPDEDVPVEAPPKRRVGRIVGRTVFGVVAGLLVIAVIAAGFVVWTIQRSFPQMNGEITVAGLEREVTVQRDVQGIPTITAETDHDLFFAQGYVHAQDRFWEMDFRRHVTSGRVSELFGESQLATDAFLRTLGWRAVAEAEVEAMDPEIRVLYDAYAEGVNAYLDEHSGADLSFEYAVLGLQNGDYEPEPWSAADSVAWLKAMAWDLRTNVEDETERALLAQQLTDEELAGLYPAYPFDEHPVIVPQNAPAYVKPASNTAVKEQSTDAATAAIEWTEVAGVVEAAHALLGGAGEGIGSNSWVVSGRLTDTGMPYLANDPHLGASLPSVWHQVGLRCARVDDACTFDVAGFGFSGVPGVVIGHNDRVAWGFTNLTTDVTDLYVEKVSGDEYLRDGQLVPLEVRTETLKVAGGDDVELEIRSTVHGPIISGLTDDFTAIAENPYVADAAGAAIPADEVAASGDDDLEYAVTLRWTALDVGTTAEAIFALDRAQNFEEFQAAAALFDVPAQNLIYADVDGNIGYQTPGKLPLRGAGDGWLPQPGWDSAYDWTGYIPFEELPTVYNPTSGYIVTANHAIVDDDYPYFLSRDWDYGYRADRIVDMIERRIATDKLTADDMRAIQADNAFWMGKELVAAYADVELDRQGPAAAVELLREWDAQNDADSAAAAYANVLWANLAIAMFVDRETPVTVGDQSRLFTVVGALLDDPESPWWTNPQIGVDGQREMLAYAADAAYDELVALQGDNPARWNWGDLHALTLTHDTFGTSGIDMIEAMFNRGPFPTGGGASVVNATGWYLGESYETVTVPSMRTVMDLSDWNASTWNQLTGVSGHAYHPNYTDQVEDWQQAVQAPWAFTTDAVTEAATDTLVLVPASR